MPSIKGRVALEPRSDVGGITVELINASSDIVDQVHVADDGSFTLYVSPGSWQLNAYDAHGHRGRSTIDVADEDAGTELVLR